MKASWRLRHLFRRRRSEAEMAEEMQFHLEQRSADYSADGFAGDESRYAALRKFGNVGRLQEEARDAWGWGWLERGLKDVRCAFRQLAQSPAFTLLAIASLALGIGANTTMFSMLNALQLKPLPYARSGEIERIDRVTNQNPAGRISPADYLDFQREAANYGEIAAYALGDTSLSEPGQPAEMVIAMRVTPNFFGFLGVHPQLGRSFRPGEDAIGRDRVAMLSERCWLHRFGGRKDIIGRSIRIDGEAHEVIGILPSSFNDWRHLGAYDIFRPLTFDVAKSADRRAAIMRILGRPAAGQSRANADAYVAAFGARLAQEHPDVNAGSSWRAVLLDRTVTGTNGGLMASMFIALSLFVLLLACSNLANLLLARTIARAREFAVRSALGASRLQLLRPLVAESLILALAGGVCAVIVAQWMADYLAYRSTGDNGEQVPLQINWLVMMWTFGVSLATAVAFGLAPALFALRLNLNDTLKSGARGAIGGRGQQRFRRLLIVGQFALAMVLLSGAVLVIRGVDELNRRRDGWNSEQLITGTIVLPAATYPDANHMAAFHRLLLEKLANLPGAASASLSSATPFFNWPETRKYLVQGRPPPKPGLEPAAIVNSVSPQYFSTVGTRILAGRAFDPRDDAGAQRVYIISESMARNLFGTENPLGRRLARAGGGELQWGEIVGIVPDVEFVLSDPVPVRNELYQPMAQEPVARAEIAVRAADINPSRLVDGIRSAMTALDPDLPVRNLQPADLRIYRANYQLRVLRDILIAMALLGLGLASLGIYGVITRTMAQRTSEFAIRLALGASIQNISRMVLASGLRLALAGSAVGLLGAWGLANVIAFTFPSMRFDNVLAFTVTTIVLIAVALLACWLPARRAGQVDAMVALRAE